MAADRGDAVITGATDAGATDSETGIVGAESTPSASTGATPDRGTGDVRFDEAVSELPPSAPGSTLARPTLADTTEPPLGPASGTEAALALRGVPGPPGRAAEPSRGDFSSAALLPGTDVEPDAPEPDASEPDPRRPESTDDPPPEETPRGPDRADRVEVDDVEDPDDGAPAESDPVDPDEPVVSANASGTDEIADPTPSATASAPTRPT